MIKIILHGKLGKVFKKEWDFEALTAKEALKAIDVNTHGDFIKYLESTALDKKIGYNFVIDDESINLENKKILLNKKLKKDSIINIIPVIGGSGTEAFWIGVLKAVIVGIVLTGISMLLMPTSKSSTDDADQKDSFIFDGRGRTSQQGSPVPLGYGRRMIEPMVINLEYVYNNKRLLVSDFSESKSSSSVSGNPKAAAYSRAQK